MEDDSDTKSDHAEPARDRVRWNVFVKKIRYFVYADNNWSFSTTAYPQMAVGNQQKAKNFQASISIW